jgi:hypothetical protein
MASRNSLSTIQLASIAASVLFFVLPACGTTAGTAAKQPTPPPALQRDILRDAQSRSKASVKIKASEPVTWRDGSLGCPQPGMIYTQGLVAGFRVTVITREGRELDYHVDKHTARFILCAPGLSRPALPPRS